MKKLIIALISVVIMVVVSCTRESPQSRSQSPTTTPSVNPRQATSQHEHSKLSRIPAYYETPPSRDVLAPTLAPELFTGNKRLAYQAAKEIPQTLAQLPCYCHCDMSIGHKSLQSCFVTEHGESCGICIGEALMAYQLEKREKLPISEIRQRIIAAYDPSSEPLKR
jgi:Protein of unknown function with PCYCGC motif